MVEGANTQSWLRRNWLAIAGLAVGVIGGGLSVFFYLSGRAVRQPYVVADPARIELINAERVASAPLQISRANGQPITTDVTALKIYVWNAGKLPIRQEHVLEPIQITVGDEILDYEVLTTSRPVVEFQASRSSSDSLRTLTVDFRILEQGDGGTIQVIYSGSKASPVVVRGTIEGATIRNIVEQGVRGGAAYVGRYLSLLIVPLLVATLMPWVLTKVERIARKPLKRIASAGAAVVLIVALAGFFVLLGFKVYEGIRALAIERVPVEFRLPNH